MCISDYFWKGSGCAWIKKMGEVDADKAVNLFRDLSLIQPVN